MQQQSGEWKFLKIFWGGILSEFFLFVENLIRLGNIHKLGHIDNHLKILIESFKNLIESIIWHDVTHVETLRHHNFPHFQNYRHEVSRSFYQNMHLHWRLRSQVFD